MKIYSKAPTGQTRVFMLPVKMMYKTVAIVIQLIVPWEIGCNFKCMNFDYDLGIDA